MKTFIHKDLLRCVNFGGNQEASDRWIERIERETNWVEILSKSLSMHDAWALVLKIRWKAYDHKINWNRPV